MINKLRALLSGSTIAAPGSVPLGLSKGMLGGPVFLAPGDAQTHTMVTSSNHAMTAHFMIARVHHCLANSIPGVFVIRTQGVLDYLLSHLDLEFGGRLSYREADDPRSFDISDIAAQKKVEIIAAVGDSQDGALKNLLAKVSTSVSAILNGHGGWSGKVGVTPNFLFEFEQMEGMSPSQAPIPSVWYAQMRALGISISVYLSASHAPFFDPASRANLNQRIQLSNDVREAELDLTVKGAAYKSGQPVYAHKKLQVQF